MELPSIEPLRGLLFTFNTISISIIIAIAVMVILLVLSALVSGSEVAFFSLDAKDKEALNSNKDNISTRVLDLLARPKRLLATILIANNFVNIAIVILSTFIINNLCDFW